MAANSRFAIAVHILTMMAWAGDEPLKSEQVACSVNTNPVVIRRIMCALQKARLVVSQTGAAGGSRLARRPGQITLLDIYRAVDAGELFSLHRQPPNEECPVGMNIETVLEDILSEVGQSIERVLAKITIEKVLQAVEPRAPALRRKVRA
jgi:Rrf2 family protein